MGCCQEPQPCPRLHIPGRPPTPGVGLGERRRQLGEHVKVTEAFCTDYQLASWWELFPAPTWGAVGKEPALCPLRFSQGCALQHFQRAIFFSCWKDDVKGWISRNFLEIPFLPVCSFLQTWKRQAAAAGSDFLLWLEAEGGSPLALLESPKGKQGRQQHPPFSFIWLSQHHHFQVLAGCRY